MFRLFTIISFLLLANAISAQKLSLKETVELAIKNSLAVEQSQLQNRGNEIQLTQSKEARYPTLSAGANAGYQFGLNVDPTTNDLVQQRIGFNSYNLNAGVVLFNGGRIKNTIKQNQALLASSEANIQQTKQDVSLQAAQLYLEVVLAKEEFKAAESRLQNAEREVQRILRFIESGNAAPADRYELESAAARQQQSLTQAQNAIENAKLRLRQLLRMPAGQNIEVSAPSEINFDNINLPVVTADELYKTAASNQPRIAAAKLSEQAAITGIKIAKANYYPRITAFGQADTRFSSSARQVDEVLIRETQSNVLINQLPATITSFVPDPVLVSTPFGNQIRDFFGQSVGLNMQVPIFNNGINKAGLEQAKLNLLQQELQTTQVEQSLKLDVQTALQAATAAKADVEASERALKAAETAYDAAQKRSDVGAGSAFQLANAQLLLQQAQISFIRARYQYLFNTKVVDFYLGKPLELN